MTLRVFGVPLPSWPRKGAVIDEIVLHESVTGSRKATLGVLKARGLSVHCIVDRDGSVTWHAPLEEQCAHAGSRHNRRSVAVEVVNRYYGAQAGPLDETIPATWAHRGVYILPTPSQLEAVWQTVVEIHEEIATIPLVFPGVDDTGFRWGRYSWLQRIPGRLPAGVVAHHRFDHADGLVPEHYCVMRAHDWQPADAYRLTVEAASSGRRVTPIPLRGGSIG